MGLQLSQWHHPHPPVALSSKSSLGAHGEVRRELRSENEGLNLEEFVSEGKAAFACGAAKGMVPLRAHPEPGSGCAGCSSTGQVIVCCEPCAF